MTSTAAKVLQQQGMTEIWVNGHSILKFSPRKLGRRKDWGPGLMLCWDSRTTPTKPFLGHLSTAQGSPRELSNRESQWDSCLPPVILVAIRAGNCLKNLCMHCCAMLLLQGGKAQPCPSDTAVCGRGHWDCSEGCPLHCKEIKSHFNPFKMRTVFADGKKPMKTRWHLGVTPNVVQDTHTEGRPWEVNVVTCQMPQVSQGIIPCDCSALTSRLKRRCHFNLVTVSH